MSENTNRDAAAGKDERLDEARQEPDVNPDAAEFRDGQRLAGSSSVSAQDALAGGAPGPLFGDDTDTVNFPDNDPAISATDNPDVDCQGARDAADNADESDDDPEAPFADIGGAGGGPGAGPGPA